MLLYEAHWLRFCGQAHYRDCVSANKLNGHSDVRLANGLLKCRAEISLSPSLFIHHSLLDIKRPSCTFLTLSDSSLISRMTNGRNSSSVLPLQIYSLSDCRLYSMQRYNGNARGNSNDAKKKKNIIHCIRKHCS